MIWNPWREIRKLRGQVKIFSDMALLECDKARYLKSHTDILDRRDIKRIKALQRIVDHEKPNSSAVVKHMAAIAREVL
jgi:tRNA(His) 5'-end guanylyltransferase